jgi:large subunit ribosomal protein L32e
MKEPSAIVPERALRLRERVKKKKPKFVRQESWKYIRLKENWRKPRGLDNKVRKKIKGWPTPPRAGYRGPRVGRGLHPSGYEKVLVYNVEQLKEVDPKTQAVQIAHTVGKRKRARILAEARKKKMTVLNLKETKELVEEEKELTEEAEREEEKLEETKEVAEEPKKEEKAKKSKRRTKEQ